jgi:hypothetical protein
MELNLHDLAWSDCSLIGQTWVSDGRDLELAVRMGDGRRMVILFTWVAGLACELTYPENEGGAPLSWDVTYTQADSRWAALWDFGNRGSLRFTFQNATQANDDG